MKDFENFPNSLDFKQMLESGELQSLKWVAGTTTDCMNADFNNASDSRIIWYSAYSERIEEYLTASVACTCEDYVEDPTKGLYLFILQNPFGGDYIEQFHSFEEGAQKFSEITGIQNPTIVV